MRHWIRSGLARYALAVLVLSILIGAMLLSRKLTGYAFDTTPLIIVWLIACSWYLGRGPGLVVAVLFEAFIDYLAPGPTTTVRFVLTVFNRFLLFASVVWFASARRIAERDLTAQQRVLEESVERERRARADAEAASRLKDEFLATVSHELRTPLNVIVGWANILSRPDVDEDASRRAIAAIARSATTQTRIVEDLLDASAMTTGKMRLSQSVIPLAPLVDEAIRTMDLAASAKRLSFDVSMDPRVSVAGDGGRLQQVALNLISNAVKFTPDGGRVEVHVSAQAGRARLTVRDNGIGIEPEFLPHAFAPFRQADASMTREQGGLGLGLSIVQRLVEMHGGTVRVESEGLGRGSLFTVDLPLAGLPRQAAKQGAQLQSRIG